LLWGAPRLTIYLGISRKWAEARFFFIGEGVFARGFGELGDIHMKGIQFVIDDKGKKKAVLIDLSEWGELWEDIHDVLVSHSRKHEPTVDWEDLKAEMGQEETKAG
jgi:hypothetical protein